MFVPGSGDWERLEALIADPEWERGRGGLDSKLRVGGNVEIEIRAARSGKLLRREVVDNHIPRVGRGVVGELLLGSGPAPSSFGIGESATLTTDSMAGLQDEVLRVQFYKRPRGGSRITFVTGLTEDEGNGYLLREAGLFAGQKWFDVLGEPYRGRGSRGGYMFARVVYTPIEKDSSIQIAFRWEINIGTG